MEFENGPSLILVFFSLDKLRKYSDSNINFAMDTRIKGYDILNGGLEFLENAQFVRCDISKGNIVFLDSNPKSIQTNIKWKGSLCPPCGVRGLIYHGYGELLSKTDKK